MEQITVTSFSYTVEEYQKQRQDAAKSVSLPVRALMEPSHPEAAQRRAKQQIEKLHTQRHTQLMKTPKKDLTPAQKKEVFGTLIKLQVLHTISKKPVKKERKAAPAGSARDRLQAAISKMSARK